MPARIRHITIDCREPYALSQLWAQALGFVDEPEDPNYPDDDPEALIVDPQGHHPGLLFVPVPAGSGAAAGTARSIAVGGVDCDADHDWEFHTAVTEPLADLLDLSVAACERSRAITFAHDLEDVGAVERPRPFTLRFVRPHMVEETARHLGHLDIPREHFDGTIDE